jgi:hypothetical protein
MAEGELLRAQSLVEDLQAVLDGEAPPLHPASHPEGALLANPAALRSGNKKRSPQRASTCAGPSAAAGHGGCCGAHTADTAAGALARLVGTSWFGVRRAREQGGGSPADQPARPLQRAAAAGERTAGILTACSHASPRRVARALRRLPPASASTAQATGESVLRPGSPPLRRPRARGHPARITVSRVGKRCIAPCRPTPTPADASLPAARVERGACPGARADRAVCLARHGEGRRRGGWAPSCTASRERARLQSRTRGD